MISIVDARTGKLVKVGETVSFPPTFLIDDTRIENSYTLVSVRVGLFSATAVVSASGIHGHQSVRMLIKWFPRLRYGAKFPVGGLRVAIYPS